MMRVVTPVYCIALMVVFLLPFGVAQAKEIKLTLINAVTDRDISEIVDGRSVNLAQIGDQINIRADISVPVSNVHFELDSVDFRTENGAPYAMAGDNAGDYLPWTPELGGHNLRVTAYDNAGDELAQKTVNFTVVESSKEVSLILINAFTDKDIASLSNEATINLNETGEQLNIRAEFTIPIDSVHFELDGIDFRTEKGAPYAMAGDEAGDYKSWTPEVGSRTLVVTAFDELGSEVVQRTLDFTVSESSEEFTLTLMNASTDKEISELINNANINLGETGQELNIRADIATPVSQVKFVLDGTDFRTERGAPYTMAGDESGDYLPWTPSSGSHTLEVITYDANGEEITKRILHFTVTDAIAPPSSTFDKSKDLISLHYDHCADPDDGHATVADRIMTLHYGITPHVVSGAYGWQMNDPEKDIEYQPTSETVSAATWGNSWLNAHDDWTGSVEKTAEAWKQAFDRGGDVWISEAGQSDFTADVIRLLHKTYSPETLQPKIHLVQHGLWNEYYTTPEDLAFVKEHTDYIKIDTGNSGDNGTAGLMATHKNSPSVVEEFIQKAKQSKYSQMWLAAFNYLDPMSDQGWPGGSKLDFSDSVELLHILGINKQRIANCTDFANIFLGKNDDSSLIVSFSASRLKINQYVGTELRWQTQNGNNVKITGISDNLRATDSIKVHPKENTTYQLIVTDGTRTEEQQLTIIYEKVKYIDTDKDGMPDEWERAVGLDPLTDDANGDKDKDGASNIEEFIYNTDPSDPNSMPEGDMMNRIKFSFGYDGNGNLVYQLEDR